MLQSVKIVLYVLMVAVSLGGSAGANYPVGDLNEDRRVDLEDLQVLAGQWLDESCLILDCEADLDGANGINTVDFALLAENWGGKGTALVMSEFMASNSKTLLDENDDSSDWIEIYNPTDA